MTETRNEVVSVTLNTPRAVKYLFPLQTFFIVCP